MFLQSVKRTWSARESTFCLVFIGDFHVGNPTCDKRLLKKHIAEIPDNALVFLMGDLAEYIDFKDKRFEAQSVDPEFWSDLDRLHLAYTEYLESLLEPIRDRIVLFHDGNHEHKLAPTYQPGYELARRLDLLERYSGMEEAYTRVRFPHERGGKVRSIMVNTHHGWQGGRMAGAKHNEMNKTLAWIAGDVVVRGHSHELFAEPAPVMVEPNRKMNGVIYRNRFTGHSGSYFQSRMVGSSNYAERSQYPPLPLGHIRFAIELGETCTTGGTGYSIRPEVVM